MAGCCGGGADVETAEICGFLADRPVLPSCVTPTDEVIVMRGSVCHTIPACQLAPRYRLVA